MTFLPDMNQGGKATVSKFVRLSKPVFSILYMVFVTDEKQAQVEGWLPVKLLYNPQETQQKWQT